MRVTPATLPPVARDHARPAAGQTRFTSDSAPDAADNAPAKATGSAKAADRQIPPGLDRVMSRLQSIPQEDRTAGQAHALTSISRNIARYLENQGNVAAPDVPGTDSTTETPVAAPAGDDTTAAAPPAAPTEPPAEAAATPADTTDTVAVATPADNVAATPTDAVAVATPADEVAAAPADEVAVATPADAVAASSADTPVTEPAAVAAVSPADALAAALISDLASAPAAGTTVDVTA